MTTMFHKVMVANRGEIAVRAFRAAYELGLGTVAVFAYEDRNADHRVKALESYLIGEEGHPVRAYLDIDEIIRAAKEAGADAIYPGYGFLSENPDLAAACAANGITFIGPSASVLEMAGNKVAAIEQARKAGVPTLASCPPSTDPERLKTAASEIGFPVFIKAVAGGGGRGMRRVDDPERFESELGAASIAAPVRNERGDVIAALSIVGPVQRLGSDSLRRFARPAVEAAMAVSRRLGYRDPRTPRRSAGESTP